MAFEEFKLNMKVKLSRLRAKYLLKRDFKHKVFTIDNMIQFYNYYCSLGYKKESDYFISICRIKDDLKFNMNTSNNYRDTSVTISFNTGGRAIRVEVVSGNSEYQMMKSNSTVKELLFGHAEINLNTYANKLISEDTREFINTLMDYISSSFISSLNNLKW